MPSPRPWYARRARVIPPRARSLSAAALLLALAACGPSGDAPAKGTASADSAGADTSALGIARQTLGPQVPWAHAFSLKGYNDRFVAAALPVLDWVDDPLRQGVSVAPGGHEIVLLEKSDSTAPYAVSKPGLYVTDLPGTPRAGPDAPAVPDSGALRHLAGVEDLNGDGDAEVWSVQYGGPRHPYLWEMRAWDRGGRQLFQLAVQARRGGADLAPETWDASRNLRADSAMYAAMEARIEALQARFAAAGEAKG
ncbi:MAG TPA: hypothetical protein VF142_16045, partial [Longimicrobium sp.]